jgi:hypothetical protein
MKTSQREALLIRQKQLKTEIADHLDILIGSAVKSPSMSGYCLTDKIKGKTVTRYVRKSIVVEAQRMTAECQQLWKRLRALSRIHWELLQLKAADLEDGSKR